MYQLFPPSEHLKDVVRYFWLLDFRTKNCHLTEYIFAYPYVNWVFTLGAPYTVKEIAKRDWTIQDTRILGPRTNLAEYVHPSGNLALGVTFQMGSTVSLFRNTTGSLTNQLISQEDLLPSHQWLTPYFHEASVESFIATLEVQLARLSNTPQAKGHTAWLQFLELLGKPENFSSSAYSLAQELKISPRQLQRISSTFSGLPPKQIQSIIRCRMAVRQILQSGNMTDFFHYGYYDQNHFIREVKRWARQTPAKLIEKLQAVS
ncbi:helix-turn-helix domain-containing protein [Algoriphagus sp. PAP.12]|uniref:helix-turn-helix domain-containing protein n=1 Tax=Algoriphagus sp. PAP.12 TaxID=2996678 RepID=UPI00227D2F72|nr:AraC family transcriptional regulator [Algoriphagus sp. PAP.12]